VAVEFNVWAVSDAHVGTDARFGRESLADAIRQSEGRDPASPGFDWDIMVSLGDDSGSQAQPDDDEGRLYVSQLGELRDHNRSQVYNVIGNHDATHGSPDGRYDTQWWHRKWIDPVGESSDSSGVENARRPFLVEGDWERYAFQAGNIRFLMMADRNDYPPPVGRGAYGGFPAGAVSVATFDWWKRQLTDHSDGINVSAHHHMLKETTVASGDWEGVDHGYHGRFSEEAPIGAAYIHFVGDEPDSGKLESFLEHHPAALDLWLGAHTHAHPDDTTGGRSHIERKWGGATFINCAALSKYHGKRNVPMSRLITFTDGSDLARVRCYMHTSDSHPQGWYEAAERTIRVTRRFEAP
jgi:hypothetical protein